MALPPLGILPINLRGVTCEKYGLKLEGTNVFDYAAFKYISKQVILEEIQLIGVMSDFEPGRKQIESNPKENILFFVDMEEKYGELFLMCYTDEAETLMMENYERIKSCESDAEQNLSNNTQEIVESTVVYEDVPIIRRPWITSTTEETETEINTSNYKFTKGQLSVVISRPKSSYKKPLVLSDCGALSFHVGSKTITSSQFIKTAVYDTATQVAPTRHDSNAQTTRNHSVERVIQYQPQHVSEGTGTDAQIDFSNQNSKSFREFLSKSTRLMESCLVGSEAFDPFPDTFKLSTSNNDDGKINSSFNTGIENELKEIRNFVDPTHSKGRRIIAVDWLPNSNEYIAVSLVKNQSLDQRLHASGKSVNATVLLWDFKQLVKPVAVLKAPAEVLSLRFNPNNPSLLVGGCATGQIVVWSLSAQLQNLGVSIDNSNDKFDGLMNESTVGHHDNSLAATEILNDETRSDDTEKVKSNKLSVITPKFVTVVERGHKRPVTDLRWLPHYTQIDHYGQLVTDNHLDGRSHQFISVAADGIIMVWDLRFENICKDELKHVARARHLTQVKEGNLAAARAMFSPVFSAHLKRLEGAGELSLCRLSLPPGGTLAAYVRSRSAIACGTEEGDVLLADLCIKKLPQSAEPTRPNKVGLARGVSVKDNNVGEEYTSPTGEYVLWLASDRGRPPVALQYSPFCSDTLLVVSDWRFSIWKVGGDSPLFISPIPLVAYTSGAWSPSRPAVLIVGCTDGDIEVWDFIDSSARPWLRMPACAPATPTTLEFLPSVIAPSTSGNSSNIRSKFQLLACGDDNGTIRVLEMPRSLSQPVGHEQSTMEIFLNKQLEWKEHPHDSDLTSVKSIAEGDNSEQDIFMAQRSLVSRGQATAASITRDSDGDNEEKMRDMYFIRAEEAFLRDIGMSPQ